MDLGHGEAGALREFARRDDGIGAVFHIKYSPAAANPYGQERPADRVGVLPVTEAASGYPMRWWKYWRGEQLVWGGAVRDRVGKLAFYP
jgi:hypothetical protein